MLLFFFSSRRRHTRFDCDWSSDVCSSDLDRHVGPDVAAPAAVAAGNEPAGLERRAQRAIQRSEEHTSELQSQSNLVCRLLLEKKKAQIESTLASIASRLH